DSPASAGGARLLSRLPAPLPSVGPARPLSETQRSPAPVALHSRPPLFETPLVSPAASDRRVRRNCHCGSLFLLSALPPKSLTAIPQSPSGGYLPQTFDRSSPVRPTAALHNRSSRSASAAAFSVAQTDLGSFPGSEIQRERLSILRAPAPFSTGSMRSRL